MVNNGTVNVTKGTLSVQVDESGTGTWALANGTKLNLDSGTFNITGATVNGDGVLWLNNGGYLTGTGTARNVVFNGGTINGAGTLTLATGGTSSLPAGQSLWMYDTARLRNQGSLTQAGLVRLLNDSSLENRGTWLLTQSGTAFQNYDGATKQPFLERGRRGVHEPAGRGEHR